MTEYPPTSPVYAWPLLQGEAPNDWRDVDDALLAAEQTVETVQALVDAAGADLAAHEAAADPHSQYATDADVAALDADTYSKAEADARFAQTPLAVDDLPSELLTEAEGDAAYAALDHTHPWPTAARDFYFSTNTNVATDPGQGNLRCNTGNLLTASTLALDSLTNDGLDVGIILRALQTDDLFFVQDKDQGANWVRYRLLAAPTSHTGYWTLSVTVQSSAGALATAQLVALVFYLQGGVGGGGAGVAADTLWDAKGDLVAGTGADTAARLAAGSNGQYLAADSATSTGLAWVANPVTAHAALPDAHHARAHDHTAADGSGTLTNDTHDGYSQYANLVSDAATPGTNQIRLYAKDNGAGTATLYYRTETGTIYELPTLGTGGGNGSGAPSNAGYVTLAAENKLSQEAVLGTAVVMRGLLSARPAAATAGRLYMATDTNLVYRDNGSGWDTFASAATGGLDKPTADGYYVDVGGDVMTGTLTLPTLTLAAGVASQVRLYGAGSPALSAAGGGPGNFEIGVRFRSTAAGTLTSVRWYRFSSGTSTPATVRLWDTTTSGIVFTAAAGDLSPFADTTVGWKTAPLTTTYTLVAGRDYILSLAVPSVNWSQSSGAYTPVPDAPLVFVDNRYGTGAGTMPTTVVTNSYVLDPGVTPSAGPTAAAGGVRLPNNTAVAWRTAANSADLSLAMDGSDRLAVAVGAGSLTTSATAGAASALPATPAGYLTVVLNGSTVAKIPYYA